MMIEPLQLIALSLIQGITEFLPISSSGHLVLLPALTDLADQGQLLDVAAHFGTLGAVVIYVRQDIIAMTEGLLTFGRRNQQGLTLGLLVIMATIPVIIVGLIVEMLAPAVLRLALTVALANMVFAGLLYKADKDFPHHRTIDDLTMQDALIIGVMQIFALIPGTSRSGVTMTAARARGFDRISAARFSMILSVPVILGATILKSRHFFDDNTGESLMQAGLVAGLSGVTALAAITLMMRWLAKADFKIFVYYRLALGVLLLTGLGFSIIT
ncbi:MAG: undecaprenyl-diphosphate phosphatase [Candidatus Puniceispirillaceae bacterium]